VSLDRLKKCLGYGWEFCLPKRGNDQMVLGAARRSRWLASPRKRAPVSSTLLKKGSTNSKKLTTCRSQNEAKPASDGD
jgi:hypothetical protein